MPFDGIEVAVNNTQAELEERRPESRLDHHGRAEVVLSATGLSHSYVVDGVLA